MVEARCEQVRDLVVMLDYGEFFLWTGTPQDDDLIVTLISQAVHADNIAQHGPVLVVLVPHQNNFAMPLRVETWDGEPPDDLAEWQEVFAASVQVGPSGLWYETPTFEPTDLGVAPGRYAMRIAGRGFLNRGWPGSTTPGDSWRIQVWPANDPVRPHRVRAWPGPEG